MIQIKHDTATNSELIKTAIESSLAYLTNQSGLNVLGGIHLPAAIRQRMATLSEKFLAKTAESGAASELLQRLSNSITMEVDKITKVVSELFSRSAEELSGDDS